VQQSQALQQANLAPAASKVRGAEALSALLPLLLVWVQLWVLQQLLAHWCSSSHHQQAVTQQNHGQCLLKALQ
jgi:hypothetical protein